MYRLDLMLGNPDATQLAEIYSSFTEGFETADLEQAAAILSQQPDSDLRRNSDSVSRVCLPNVGLPDKIVAASAIRQ